MEGVSRIGELGKRLRMLAGRLVVRAGLLMMVVLSSLFFASYASAATIEIDNFTDGTGQTAICDPAQPGKCTLRAAISKANTTPGPHTIVIPDGTVELEQGVLEVKNSISIVGKSGDPAKAIIRNKPVAFKRKIFDINPMADNAYTISLESISVRDGAASYANGDGYGGGGISAFINTAGMFTISNSVITGNSTTGDILYGGGLNVAGEAGGKLYIRNTVIQNNQAEKKGGGMFLEGDMDVEITHSSIDGNTARSGLGGGLSIEGMTNNLGSVLITGSTFSRNRADGTDSAFSGGGGIHLNRAATLTNTTLSGNTSAGKGAGLLVSNYAGTTTVNHATIYQNVANGDGGGIYLDKGSPIIHNSIVSGNKKAAAANDVAVSGSLSFATQSTNNLFGIGSGGLTATGGNLLNVANPGLLGLQANGGFAETHALAPDSPARDKGNNTISDLFDQRGFPRQTGSSVDIGAYEGLPDQSMQGNTTKTIVLAVGDEAKVTNVQASSPTSALLPNGSIAVTGTGSSRSLAITPALNQTGTAVIMVQVDSETSGVKRTVTNSFTLTVTAPPLPDLTISKIHTGNFTQGQNGGQYRISVSNAGSVASSGSVTVSDAVPQGLTLKSLVGTGWTCSVTGSQCTRSDALGAGASYPDITVTVDVADSAPASLTNTATLSGGGDQNTTNNSASDLTTVIAKPTVTTESLPEATVNKSYQSAPLEVSGGQSPYSWAMAGGDLPTGLTLSASGVVSGTPTVANTFTFTVEVTDAKGVKATKGLTIKVNPELTVSTVSLPDGAVNVDYSQQLAAAGGNGSYTWAVTVGSLPNGLTLDASTGVISGKPTAAGTVPFTVEVTDGNNVKATVPLTMIVNPELIMNAPAVLPQGTVGAAYNEQTFTATGGNGAYVWSVEGNLPAGLTFDPATRKLAGTPTTAGVGRFTIKVVDGNGTSATKVYDLTVNPQLTIDTTSLKQGTVTKSYSETLTASGGNGTYTWTTVAGNLPDGLILNGAAITGVPTQAGPKTFTLQVTDGNGVMKTEEFTIQVNPELVMTAPTLPQGTVGTSYTDQIFTAAGGNGVYTWSVTGNFPAGLTFDAAQRKISGTPTTAGTFDFAVVVTDGNGVEAKKDYTVEINPQLIITAPAFPQGTVGIWYPDKTFTAAGGNGLYTWAFSGDLPAGLTFDIVQRKISGTPTEAGAFDFTVTVTDGNGVWVTQFIELQVNAALEIKTTTLKDATVGMSYSETLVASGGDGNYSWTKVSDDLPDGLVLATVSNNVYAIAGIPTTKDAKTFTVRVTDGNGVTKDQQLTLQVNLPVLTSIQFKQSSYNVQAGQQQPTVLTGNYSDNSTSDITSGVTYQIDGAIASVDSSTGTVTGIKQGTTVLKATYGSQTALTTIIVDTQLSKLTLDAPSYQIELGQSKTAKVTAVYTDGAHQDVTANAIYAIDNPAIAEIDSHGVIRALRPGVAELSASYGVQTATATIIVNPAPQGPMTMSFGKATYDVSVGQSQATVVSVTYDGRTYPLTSGVVYHIGDSSIATVDANGTVYGKQSGQTVLTATYGSVQGTLLAHTVVLVGSDIKEIRFSQEQYSSRIGERTQAVVTAKLSDNSAVDVTGLTAYTVQNPSIASIGKDGVITAIQSGDTVITATYGGYSTTTRVVVYGRGGGGGGGGSGSSSGGSTPTPDNGVSVPIIIGDGKTETERISVEDIQKGVVVLNTASVSGTAELSAATISSLLSLNPELLVAFQTAAGTIEVPLATMDPQILAKLLGIPAEGLKVQIGIREPNENEQQQFAAAMKEMGSTQLAKPLDFFINIVDGQGKLVNTDGFKNYIVRVLPLTAAADPNTATGVWWDPTSQQFRFVPTVFEMRDGQPVAKLKRQGLSFYTVLSSHIAFGDMASHWAKPTVETLASKLIIQGRSKDSFEPNGSITRAEWAALLVRALGLSDAKDKAPFSDVNGQWFAAAVNTAYKAKLIEGYDDGTFRPNQTVTREELAAMVMRAVSYVGAKPNNKQGQGVSFTDGADISTWATEAVKQAVQAGIIEGDSQGQFRPAQSASRAEAATMLYRLLKAVQFM